MDREQSQVNHQQTNCVNLILAPGQPDCDNGLTKTGIQDRGRPQKMLVQRRGHGCLSRSRTNRFALDAVALVLAGCVGFRGRGLSPAVSPRLEVPFPGFSPAAAEPVAQPLLWLTFAG